MICPTCNIEMFRLNDEPTVSNPNGRRFPTWWCDNCGALATRGVFGNQITVKIEARK